MGLVEIHDRYVLSISFFMQGQPMGLGKLGDRLGPPNAVGPPFYTCYSGYMVIPSYF